MGGVICPGIGISADALFQKTARLPRVAIRKPARVIGSTTVGSLQSGLYYGYLGLVDGILERLLEEMGGRTTVVATGGLAALIGKGSKYIKHVDDLLTLDGLRLIWERNAEAKSGRERRSPRKIPPPRRRPAASRAPAEPSWKTTSTISPKSKSSFNGAGAASCCFRLWTGHLIETWKDAGIPLEAVLRGIDGAFERYEKRPTPRKVNSLAYCAQEVLAAAEEMKEAAVGAVEQRPAQSQAGRLSGGGHRGFSAAQRRPAAHRKAAGAARNFRDRRRREPRPARCVSWLRRWKSPRRGWKTWNGGLRCWKRNCSRCCWRPRRDDEIVAVRAEADRELSPYRRKMPAAQIDQLQKQYLHKRLLEKYGLPRLSLFYM